MDAVAHVIPYGKIPMLNVALAFVLEQNKYARATQRGGPYITCVKCCRSESGASLFNILPGEEENREANHRNGGDNTHGRHVRPKFHPLHSETRFFV